MLIYQRIQRNYTKADGTYVKYLASEVFVLNKGVNAQPLKFETFLSMPTHMNLTAKSIHKQIYDSA